MAVLSPIQVARFWSRIQPATDFQCWEWGGVTTEKGYGRFNGAAAHRLAYQLVHGPIPDGQVIRHVCDNPPCCNPAHLLIGSQKDNVRDSVRRGRFAKGARSGRSKLTDAQVREIHVNPERLTVTALARKLGVAVSTVSMIRSGHRRVVGREGIEPPSSSV